MNKLLLLILVILAVWWLAKGFRRKDAARNASEAVAEQMVACSHCGVNLPRSEAIGEGGRYFCCAEHRRLAR
ncbi:MAG: hypothetical protein IH605_20855 [Burkholderiales bacterium]|nr:hypothetical protein [Burkholderiales bacterium]